MLVHKLILGMFILMNCLKKDFVCLITIVVHVDRLFDQSCCVCYGLIILFIFLFILVCRSKNKQSSPCRLQRFGPALLLQMFADVVRRLQTFYLRKNKQHLN
ncbi:hypothetical protein Hanom_Chr10g00893941 [Helianthus anomalus]